MMPGAKVLILEKQPADTPTQTRHTPSTRMSGGGWFWPEDKHDVVTYMEALTRAASEPLTPERKEQIAVFADYLVSNMDWMNRIGVPAPGEESVNPMWKHQPGTKVVGGRVYRAEYPGISGLCLLLQYLRAGSRQIQQGPRVFQAHQPTPSRSGGYRCCGKPRPSTSSPREGKSAVS